MAEQEAAKRTLTKAQLIERSIIKKYRKTIWHPFVVALDEYALIEEGDRIAVCISGGKDSFLMAKLLQEVQRHGKVKFDLTFLCMDPGYNEANRRKIEENAALMDIPLTVFETDVFQIANNQERNPCYLCARMRRGWLYSQARDLGCNKIALGHHFDDVIETTVMGMFYSSELGTMPPKLHSQNYPGMELIRPLYRVREQEIISWAQYNGLEFLQCACRFTEDIALSEDGVGHSKRQDVKLLIRELAKDDPDLPQRIFNSVHNVRLDTVPGYNYRGVDHSFLEDYENFTPVYARKTKSTDKTKEG